MSVNVIQCVLHESQNHTHPVVRSKCCCCFCILYHNERSIQFASFCVFYILLTNFVPANETKSYASIKIFGITSLSFDKGDDVGIRIM